MTNFLRSSKIGIICLLLIIGMGLGVITLVAAQSGSRLDILLNSPTSFPVDI